MKGLTIALLVGLLAMPAMAQPKPSFDCAKASTDIEKLICGSPELAKSDAALGATYSALSAKLDAKAKDHLAKDETSWIVRRSHECVGTAALMYDCVKYGYEERIGRLKMYGDGPYPFVSTHGFGRQGRVKAVAYTIAATYPQFDGTSADFGATNKRFADETTRAAAEATPGNDDDLDREQAWSYEQDFTLARPVATAISVKMSTFSFTGGAHPNGAAWAALVDLKTGKTAGLNDVFSEGWLKQIVVLAHADLEQQFRKRPGFDDALQPQKLAKLVRDPKRYWFERDKLTVIFNRDELGPYVVGPYDVGIPMSEIKGLLRADGPLGALK